MPRLFSLALEVPASRVKQERATDDIQTGKEEGRLSLFTDDAIVCVDIQRALRKSLRINNGFSKFAGYKINQN